MRSYLILTMCLLFLMYYFVNSTWLGYLVVIIAILAFLTSAYYSRGFPRIIGSIMMGVGITLELNKGAGIEGVSQGVLLILPLLCLVTLSPLLSMPLKISGYFKSVESLLQNLLHHPKKLFFGITSSLFILSPILNLGSIRIISEFLENLKLPAAMSAKSYLIGFSSALMWSPYFASVSLVLYYLNMPVGRYILYGLCLSFLSLLIGNLLFFVWQKKHSISTSGHPEKSLDCTHKKQLVKLVLFVILIMISSLAIEYVTKWSMVIIVSLISITLPLIWGILSNGWKKLNPLLKVYRDQSVPMLNNEIMLFMSAGVLAHAIQGTTLANRISDSLTIIANQSFLLFALAVMGIVLVITYIGVHQIAVIAALAMQLNADELGISNLALAMLLLLTWSISASLSPFSGLNLMVSRLVGMTGVQTGLRTNGAHLIVLAILGISFVIFMK
ncbi:hypothetical protein RYX56_00710 [Alkalihalophilus lindianensis]|uniref:Tripartite ATP-independent transporter DctM subunit n=1 Tax=Alkalihalophilus lindianensis TaxID=1630542 RepID=A0ABU3X4R8_9BACI|nr:hypothetical protein [Alkalihalophilus lindianensis]MDV2682885.1 hypothetical protein [Alkalihalophilus lindianensis]